MMTRTLGTVLGAALLACTTSTAEQGSLNVDATEGPAPIDLQAPDEVQVAIFGLG